MSGFMPETKDRSLERLQQDLAGAGAAARTDNAKPAGRPKKETA